MRNKGVLPQLVDRVNGCVGELRGSPRWGRLVSTPVAYQRTGDIVTISVRLPEAKNWWRNFTGDGGPLSLELDGADHRGHAVAHRDDKGRVTVTVRLG